MRSTFSQRPCSQFICRAELIITARRRLSLIYAVIWGWKVYEINTMRLHSVAQKGEKCGPIQNLTALTKTMFFIFTVFSLSATYYTGCIKILTIVDVFKRLFLKAVYPNKMRWKLFVGSPCIFKILLEIWSHSCEVLLLDNFYDMCNNENNTYM